MLKWRTSHPSIEDLIRYCDGELPRRPAEKVARHVQSCWECRSELESTNAIVQNYMHYHKNVLHAWMPAAPHSWNDIRRDFARLTGSDKRIGWRAILLRLILTYPTALACTAVSLVASVVIAFSILVHAPASEVDQLLEKGIMSENAASRFSSIEIRTRTYAYSRPARINKSFASVDGIDKRAESMAALFKDANFSWDDPLSAESFAEWRRHLSNRRDDVKTIRKEKSVDRYQIQTSAPTSAIRQATIALSASDFETTR